MENTLRERIARILLDCAIHFKHGDEEQMYGGVKQILNLIKEEYPIMYQEEADMVGDFIRRGWIPPEHFKMVVEELKVIRATPETPWSKECLRAAQAEHDNLINQLKERLG